MLYLMELNHNVTNLHNHPMPCVGGKFCGRLVDISIRFHLIPNVAVQCYHRVHRDADGKI